MPFQRTNIVNPYTSDSLSHCGCSVAGLCSMNGVQLHRLLGVSRLQWQRQGFRAEAPSGRTWIT